MRVTLPSSSKVQTAHDSISISMPLPAPGPSCADGSALLLPAISISSGSVTCHSKASGSIHARGGASAPRRYSVRAGADD